MLCLGVLVCLMTLTLVGWQKMWQCMKSEPCLLNALARLDSMNKLHAVGPCCTRGQALWVISGSIGHYEKVCSHCLEEECFCTPCCDEYSVLSLPAMTFCKRFSIMLALRFSMQGSVLCVDSIAWLVQYALTGWHCRLHSMVELPAG